MTNEERESLLLSTNHMLWKLAKDWKGHWPPQWTVEDVYQEMWCEALRIFPKWDPEGGRSWSSWLYRGMVFFSMHQTQYYRRECRSAEFCIAGGVGTDYDESEVNVVRSWPARRDCGGDMVISDFLLDGGEIPQGVAQ